ARRSPAAPVRPASRSSRRGPTRRSRRSPTGSTTPSRRTAPTCATAPRRSCAACARRWRAAPRASTPSSSGSRARTASAPRSRSRSSPSAAAGPSWPFAVVELGNRLAEAAAEAREEAERILRELSALVAAHEHALTVLVEAAAQLDLALACGALSRRHRGAPVEIADEVSLAGARHPLLDPAAAVPIDLDLGDLRALVISGPNTGGKTVALKTLGLAALLHQCGIRPPAERA